MMKAYLTYLPCKFLRAMAGFNPSVQGNFYLPHVKVMPPPSLKHTMWPWVDEWLEWFELNVGDKEVEQELEVDIMDVVQEMEVMIEEIRQEMQMPPPPQEEEEEEEEEDDRYDLTGQGFLRLLRQLRVILLQDSVLMRQEFPDHLIWADPIFARDDYAAFMKDVKLSLLDVEEPKEIQIWKTLPAITERLSILQ